MYTLDTNAIIYYLKNDRPAVIVLRKILRSPARICVSAVTELELFSFSKMSKHELRATEAILGTLSVVALNSRIARIAGSLRRHSRLKVADSAIAATALATGSTLVTRNVKDFRRIAELSIQPL